MYVTNFKLLTFKHLDKRNIFVLADCCRDQTMKYLVHGLHNKEWNPQQYISKLTDYDNETKPLNYISVYFFHWFSIKFKFLDLDYDSEISKT